MRFPDLIASIALMVSDTISTRLDTSIGGMDDQEEDDVVSENTTESCESDSDTSPAFPFNVSPGITLVGRSERLRIIESYNTSLIEEKISADAAAKIAFQITRDKQYDLFTPNTQFPDSLDDSSDWTEYTPLGEIRLGQRIYQGYESVIFTIKDMDDYLIKYQANCDEIRDSIDLNEPILHPLLTDYWYSREAQSHGLSPEVIFISPPALVCESQFGKCDFTMDEEDYTKCLDRWGVVRFMIMRKAHGIDLQRLRQRYPDGVVPFAQVMSFGVAIMTMLKKLHLTARIVHGDLHAANILYVNQKQAAGVGGSYLQFIDFGRSFRLTRERSNEQRYESDRFGHFLFTHWQAAGFEWGARDDVMKAIQIMAQMMNKWTYYDYEKQIEKRGYEYLRSFKQTAFIFSQGKCSKDEHPHNPIGTLPISELGKQYIWTSLSHLLGYARSLHDINTIPDYDSMIAILDACRKVATGALKVALTADVSSYGTTTTTTNIPVATSEL